MNGRKSNVVSKKDVEAVKQAVLEELKESCVNEGEVRKIVKECMTPELKLINFRIKEIINNTNYTKVELRSMNSNRKKHDARITSLEQQNAKEEYHREELAKAELETVKKKKLKYQSWQARGGMAALTAAIVAILMALWEVFIKPLLMGLR